MHFEWDEAKARRNLLKHGVAFDVAMRVFDDERALSVMDRVVEGEERWRTVGRVGVATILFVGHTWVDDEGEIFIRMITARRASRREIQAYEFGDEGHFG